MAKANTLVQNLDHLPAALPSIKVQPQPGLVRSISQPQIDYWISPLTESWEWEMHELQCKIRALALEVQHRLECERELRRLNSPRHQHKVAHESSKLHKTFKAKVRLNSRSPKQNARKQRRLRRVG